LVNGRVWRYGRRIPWSSDISNGDAAATGPLAGVRVLDLCRLLPGAFATGLLVDLGADVLKVEQPGIGDPMRVYEPRIGDASAFTWITDRNKRSIALNLRDPRGAEILLRLAADADVLVESFRPGVVDRLGVGYEAARAFNPQLVYCSISGYGSDGPLAPEAGHDLNYVGRAGLLSVTGVGDRPAIPGVPVGDLAGGSLLGLAGLLAALVQAQRTGEGDHVDISMTDGAFALNALLLGAFFVDGRPPGIESELLNGRFPCYAIYECADGRHVTVGALEQPFWRTLCEAVGRPDLIPTQMDPDALPEWRTLFASRPRDEWLAIVAGRDACLGPVNDLADAVADPQLLHRGMVVELEHPEAGPTPQLGTPIKLREHPASIRCPAPALGASTRSVLEALGYGPGVVDGLVSDGVVADGQS
jgi:crotonobetainyl-CoA:carnitine CoA-transferase CaiB-like acyl-CoA transferase